MRLPPLAPDRLTAGCDCRRRDAEPSWQYQDAVDGHWEIQEIFSAGERGVARWIGSGTHQDELLGVAPTGASIVIDAISIFRIEDGKIVEEWTVWDALGLMQQIGAVPAPV